VKIEWNDRKNNQNIRKHVFSLADAWEVFERPMLANTDASDVFEQRISAIGFLRQHVVVVIFAEREDDTIRIISLRKASKYERKRFEEFLRDELGAD
jgi:uncharacterized DUF497 family protein